MSELSALNTHHPAQKQKPTEIARLVLSRLTGLQWNGETYGRHHRRSVRATKSKRTIRDLLLTGFHGSVVLAGFLICFAAYWLGFLFNALFLILLLLACTVTIAKLWGVFFLLPSRGRGGILGFSGVRSSIG